MNFTPGDHVEWNHGMTEIVCIGIVKSVSKNGRIVFILITWPAPGKYIALDVVHVRHRSDTE